MIDNMRIRTQFRFSLLHAVILAAWTVSLFSYFFQFPISQLASLIVPALAVYIAGLMFYRRKTNLDHDWAIGYMIYLGYLALMVVLSIIQGNEIGSILRFLMILAIIPLFGVLKLDHFKYEYRIFLFLAVAKCLVLLYFAFQLLLSGDYLQLRHWAEVNKYGDIYISATTHLPKVQVQGNGILPMAFIINAVYGKRGKLNNIINMILAAGVLAAGNSAFLLGVAAFYFYRLVRILVRKKGNMWKQLFSMLVIVGGGLLFVAYAVYTLYSKSDYSNAVRLDQAKALLNCPVIIGNGIGHRIIYEGVFRSYDGNTYFELQTLYIFNQIGLIGLTMFFWLVFRPIRRIGKLECALFLIYLIYSFWNPYCFDSTEMIVISILINMPRYVQLRNWKNYPARMLLEE